MTIMREYLFKLKIMPDGSENEQRMAKVQEFLFKRGYRWGGGSTQVQFARSPYLYAYKIGRKKQLSYGDHEETFQTHEAPEWDISHLEI